MDSSMVIIFIAVGALAAAGFLLPPLIGDSYYFAKWRLVAVLFVILFIWILLTPNGCQFPS